MFRWITVGILVLAATAVTSWSLDQRATSGQIQVTPENYDQLLSQSALPSLIGFWTPECPPSVDVHELLDGLAIEYAGRLQVGSVNLQTHPPLGWKFGIERIPTLIFFRDGKIERITIGRQSREQLRQQIERVLLEDRSGTSSKPPTHRPRSTAPHQRAPLEPELPAEYLR